MSAISPIMYRNNGQFAAAAFTIEPKPGTRCCFHASDSCTFQRMYSASSAGNPPAQNIARHPQTGSTTFAAIAARIYPHEYPDCTMPEINPRRAGGMLSMASDDPRPHSPPMPIP